MVRIGTWNLENLFRPGGESGPKTPEAYAAKLASLAATINEYRPDVLAVQEIGSPEALDDLTNAVGGNWYTELNDDTDPRHIRVAFMSRRRMTHVDQVRNYPAKVDPIQVNDNGGTSTTLGRPALQVRVKVGTRSIDIITCHLKSKLLTFGKNVFSTTDEDKRARFGMYVRPHTSTRDRGGHDGSGQGPVRGVPERQPVQVAPPREERRGRCQRRGVRLEERRQGRCRGRAPCCSRRDRRGRRQLNDQPSTGPKPRSFRTSTTTYVVIGMAGVVVSIFGFASGSEVLDGRRLTLPGWDFVCLVVLTIACPATARNLRFASVQ